MGDVAWRRICGCSGDAARDGKVMWGRGIHPSLCGVEGNRQGAEVWGPKGVGQGLWGGPGAWSDVPLSPGQSFNTYFSNEHSRLLTLWRQVVAFRRHFGEMKATTERSAGSPGGWWRGAPLEHLPEPQPGPTPRLPPCSRDLSELRHEASRAARAAHAACLHLAANLRLAESQAGAAREQQALRLAQLEEQLAARAREADLEKGR